MGNKGVRRSVNACSSFASPAVMDDFKYKSIEGDLVGVVGEWG